MAIQQDRGGVLIRVRKATDFATARQSFIDQAVKLGIDEFLEVAAWDDGHSIKFRMRKELRNGWMADSDTLQLCERFQLDPLTRDTDLEREILLAMLLCPVTLEYPSYSELVSSIRIRQNIVKASRRTELSFHTSKIERPTDYWTYTKETGFTVLPGKPLIEALRKATQPELSGEQYAFSCYRATEYLILLGIAQELAKSNPELLHQLQRQWEKRAIMSRQFHDVFTHEYGSMDEPLPPKYYIPGDRLWFRNPDKRSREVMGYEGSWVFYLGGGLFTNFWNRDQPYTLVSKCIEMYHWRSGVYQDSEGNLQMDELIVEEHVRATMNDPAEAERILSRMMRLRDPLGVCSDGGCIDASREYPRWVCPHTTDLVLPDVERCSEPRAHGTPFSELRQGSSSDTPDRNGETVSSTYI